MKLKRIVWIVLVVFTVSCCKKASEDTLKYINPFMDSTGPTDSDYGGTILSVAPPFAMSQWCAMTRGNFISSNPYNYGDTTIIGIIGTHQPAIGMGDYGFVSFLPSTGEVKISPEQRAIPFSHKNEKASPYCYSVEMNPAGGKKIAVEMAASLRCAIFNITFPEGCNNHLFVEAS